MKAQASQQHNHLQAHLHQQVQEVRPRLKAQVRSQTTQTQLNNFEYHKEIDVHQAT